MSEAAAPEIATDTQRVQSAAKVPHHGIAGAEPLTEQPDSVSARPDSKKEKTVISATSYERDYWRTVWANRELAMFLAWRDLIVRYKQTAIGLGWTLLRPLATVLVYTIVFGIIAGLPDNGLPYALLVLTGLLPWQLFQLIVVITSDSLITNSALINKVYFPRIIIPFSSIVVCVVDHLIAFALLVVLMVWYGIIPGWQFLLLPFISLLCVCTALGLGLIAASLNVRYRDIRQLIPIVLQLGVFICPVAYLTSLLPVKWQYIYALNPMVGVIDAFRWSVFGRTDIIFPPSILVSILFAAVTMTVGIRMFRRVEATVADTM